MYSIGIAMSGGVDSSVSAALLKEQGFDVYGFFMQLPLAGAKENRDRVKAVAEKLGIQITVVALEEVFTEQVVDMFIETYRKGRTPNPCIICNRQVKFGALRKFMHDHGMDKIATGHYARIGKTSNGSFAVRRGLDHKKDQSYFLCRLVQEQLSDMVLPLGELTKKEVYKIASELDLAGVHGPESQDVCFLAGRSIAEFFQEQGLKDTNGDIVTPDGHLLGRHQGLWHYTIGQRRGLGLPDATPWYVKQLDGIHNRVIVCKHEELITDRAFVAEVQWTHAPSSTWEGHVQIRGRCQPARAHLEMFSGNVWQIRFSTPQRAVTPGQFAVFYEDDLICGSGIITDKTLAGEGSTK